MPAPCTALFPRGRAVWLNRTVVRPSHTGPRVSSTRRGRLTLAKFRQDPAVISRGDGPPPAERDAQPSPYFEPLIRSLLIGIVSGGACETFWTLSKMAALAGSSSDIWRHMMATPPHFVQDHILAVTLWLLLYMAESAGLASRKKRVLRKADVLMTKLAALPSLLVPTERLRMLLPQRSGSATAPQDSAAPFVVAQAPTPPSGRGSSEGKRVHMRFTGRKAPPSPAFVADRPARPGLKPGEWDPAQGFAPRKDIAKRTYLQDMYYCAGALPAAGLKPDTVHEAIAIGKKLAYWQDKKGAIHAVSSICSHRGAQLVRGWVDEVDGESCVRCPYHSWAFAGDGILRHVPSESGGAFPKRALQESFDVRAQDGLLWLYWGNPRMPEAVRAPIPGRSGNGNTPPLATQDWQAITYTAMCMAPHHNVLAQFACERAITRAATVLLGYKSGALVPASAPERLPFAIRQKFALHVTAAARSTLRPSGRLPAVVPVEVIAELPSSVTLRFQLEGNREVQLLAHVQPASFDTTAVTLQLRRNFRALPGADSALRQGLVTLADERRDGAEAAPDGHEVQPSTHSSSSGGVFDDFDSLRAEFVTMGYGVPPEVAHEPHRMDL